MITAKTGSGGYNGPAVLAYMQHLNTVVTGVYDGWESFGVPYDGTHNGSMHAFTQAVQSGSLQPNGTILLADYDAQALNSNIAATNLVANKMDLLTVYPSGSHVFFGGAAVTQEISARWGVSRPSAVATRTPTTPITCSILSRTAEP